MKFGINENEKKEILNLHNLNEQSLPSSYNDSSCYKEYPNATINGITGALKEMPNTISQLNLGGTQYSSMDLVVLSKLICIMNQTLYSVYYKKWQKEISKELYLNVSNLIQTKCSGLLYFKDGIERFRDRYDNLKKLIEIVYK